MSISKIYPSYDQNLKDHVEYRSISAFNRVNVMRIVVLQHIQSCACGRVMSRCYSIELPVLTNTALASATTIKYHVCFECARSLCNYMYEKHPTLLLDHQDAIKGSKRVAFPKIHINERVCLLCTTNKDILIVLSSYWAHEVCVPCYAKARSSNDRLRLRYWLIKQVCRDHIDPDITLHIADYLIDER